jgi:hypothetical protein
MWRLPTLISITILLLALLLPVVPVKALTNTSLTPSDPRSSQAGTDYTFASSNFTTGITIRCIDLILNSAADGSGSAVGTTTSFTLGTGTDVITDASWTENTGVNGRMRVTFATGETPAASGNIVFENVTNGAAEAVTYYGIFTSYTDASCTPGNEVDEATVAYVLKDGELVELTIDPTLTFTCSPVAVGQDVNGVTTTTASTATGIDHENNVTTGQNGISAHDLNVATNAPGGYTVYVRHTGQLVNAAADTIDNFAGTNVSPTTFTAAGTEGWGYTTEDNNLAGGTNNRFTTASNFAGFSTANEPVVDNTAAPVGTETTRVGHQVGVSATTPAGTYQTTIIYTVASVY